MTNLTPSETETLEMFDEKFAHRKVGLDEFRDSLRFEEVKSFLLFRTAQALNNLKMDYLLAFGKYVPLGGHEVEPEVMAKEVIRVLNEIAREKVLKEAIDTIEGKVEEMNKCWCGGGKHFAKSRVVIHTSECALNNEGFYTALSSIKSVIKELRSEV